MSVISSCAIAEKAAISLSASKFENNSFSWNQCWQGLFSKWFDTVTIDDYEWYYLFWMIYEYFPFGFSDEEFFQLV